MGDIALRGNKLTAAKSGRARLWHGGSHNTGRTNLLEQLGRVEGERSNPNRRAEISRVHGELNRGYAKGGRAGFIHGSVVKAGKILAKKFKKKKVYPETEDLTHQVGPYVGDVGSEGKRRRAGPKAGRGKSPGPQARPPSGGPRKPWGKKPKWKPPIGKFPPPKRKSKPPIGKFPPEKGKWQEAAEGGRIGLKKGGNGKWMQKVSASIKKRGTKGKCTPITKPGCTGRAKALAKTYKKIAARRKG